MLLKEFLQGNRYFYYTDDEITLYTRDKEKLFTTTVYKFLIDNNMHIRDMLLDIEAETIDNKKCHLRLNITLNDYNGFLGQFS